jgi:Putative Actinobacterial Holin-X, holin superfamily III
MSHADEPRGERPKSIFGQARELIGGLVQLAKLELAHGRQEIGAMLAEAKLGVALFGVAAAIGLLCLITVDIAVVLGVSALFDAVPDLTVVVIIVATFTAIVVLYVALGAGVVFIGNPIGPIALVIVTVAFAVPAYFGFSPGWMAALFVFVVQVALAGLAVVRGVKHMRIGPPEETIASVKEDIAWAKRLLRRG